MPGLLYLTVAQFPGVCLYQVWVAVETSAGPSYSACKVQDVEDVLPPDGGNNSHLSNRSHSWCRPLLVFGLLKFPLQSPDPENPQNVNLRGIILYK